METGEGFLVIFLEDEILLTCLTLLEIQYERWQIKIFTGVT